jgi:hypothetical protein
VGEDEVLLDDSRRFVEHAVAAGVDAELDVWEGMVHGFLGGIGRLAASTEALDLIGSFLTKCFNNSATQRNRNQLRKVFSVHENAGNIFWTEVLSNWNFFSRRMRRGGE